MEKPLIVDMDGTLTPIDTLQEGVVRLLTKSPFGFISAIPSVLGGKGAFRSAVAQKASLPVQELPYNRNVLAFLETEKHSRPLILATGASEAVAMAVAGHLKVFDAVIASDSSKSIGRGMDKLSQVRDVLGADLVFDYVGDSTSDIPMWQAADSRYLVSSSATSAERFAQAVGAFTSVFECPRVNISTWLRAMRPHQWAKNLLVFVPLLLSRSFSAGAIGASLLAFILFSMLASSVYIANDISDLDSDRAHPKKRDRPFASGELGLLQGLIVSLAMMLTTLVGSWLLSPMVTWVLLSYLVLNILYSTHLKRAPMVDVIILGSFYSIRLLVGGFAVGISLSPWLLAFSSFFFVSLAFAKRYAELINAPDDRVHIRGRGYTKLDGPLVMNLGVAAGYCACVVFGLYINSETVRTLYPSVEVLWFMVPLFLYWVSRIWMFAARGEMHHDPVVFALRDQQSLALGLASVGILVLASFGS